MSLVVPYLGPDPAPLEQLHLEQLKCSKTAVTPLGQIARRVKIIFLLLTTSLWYF